MVFFVLSPSAVGTQHAFRLEFQWLQGFKLKFWSNPTPIEYTHETYVMVVYVSVNYIDKELERKATSSNLVVKR